ncbi:MAG: DUF4349 domain-containing protein [Lachnospiraceae bacterium]|nr:DUF4349 domain-containing protein [Lachnospiraceae bacterium]
MKKTKIALILMSCLLLTGCGNSADSAGSSAYTGSNFAVSSKSAAPEMAEEAAADSFADAAATGGAETVEQNPQHGRKLITTLRLNAETENLAESLTAVEQKVTELGGYIQSSDTSYASYYNEYDRGGQSTYLVLRIPAEKLDVFLECVESATNITNKSTSVEDVTLQYVDLESHKSALLAEEARLQELMEQAETIEDLITIEDKLADVRYQLESMESQIRTYDNQIDYSTVYLDITEVNRTTSKPQTTWERMISGFGDSLYGVGIGIRDFFVGVVIYLPYIVVWGLIILCVVLIIKKVHKKKTKPVTNPVSKPEQIVLGKTKTDTNASAG